MRFSPVYEVLMKRGHDEKKPLICVYSSLGRMWSRDNFIMRLVDGRDNVDVVLGRQKKVAGMLLVVNTQTSLDILRHRLVIILSWPL